MQKFEYRCSLAELKVRRIFEITKKNKNNGHGLGGIIAQKEQLCMRLQPVYQKAIRRLKNQINKSNREANRCCSAGEIWQAVATFRH